MLPGLRFLFAATLMSASLLVFGMGAIALLRASHQQFASTTPAPPPEPVFARAPGTVPSLSMLRADPAPAAPPLADVVPAQQDASLSTADRLTDPAPLASKPSAETSDSSPRDEVRVRSEAATPANPTPDVAVTPQSAPDVPKEALQVAPLAEKPSDAQQPAMNVAQAPAQAEPASDSVAKDNPTPVASPAESSQAAVAAPPAPETTGSIAPPDEPPAAKADADQPKTRREVAALTPAAAKPVDIKPTAKHVAKRKVRHVRVRHVQRKREKLPTTTSAPQLNLGSLFGGGG